MWSGAGGLGGARGRTGTLGDSVGVGDSCVGWIGVETGVEVLWIGIETVKMCDNLRRAHIFSLTNA